MNYGAGNIVFASKSNGGSGPSGAANVKVLDYVTDILPFDGTLFDEILVKDKARGGTFLKYAGAQPNDNGVIFTDSVGQLWKRVIENDLINIQWFGAIGVTVQQFDSLAAFNASYAAALKTEFVSYPNIFVPGLPPTYHYFITDTITIQDQIHLFGEGQSSVFSPFNDKTGFIFSYTDAGNSLIENIKLDPYAGTDITKHGFDIHCLILMKDCTAMGFPGNGFNFSNGVPTSNSNNSQLFNCSSTGNGLHGFYMFGSDSNHMEFVGCSAVSNDGVGFCDDSFLGNSQLSSHAATNGSPDLPGQRGLVTDGTDTFQALQDGFSGQPLSNTAYWYNIGPAFTPFVPAYNSGTTYYRAGSYFLTGLNQFSVLLNCYGEGDQGPAHIAERSFVLSGLHQNGVVGLNFYADQNAMQLDGGPLKVNDTLTNTGINTTYSFFGFQVGKTSADFVQFFWDDLFKALKFGDNTYFFGPGVTAAMQQRTAAITNILGIGKGILTGTLQNSLRYYFEYAASQKPTVTGESGDMYKGVVDSTIYYHEAPEILLYRNLKPGINWSRIMAFCEYEFQTTNAAPFVIFQDDAIGVILYNAKYQIDILAVNAANGEAYTEIRADLVTWLANATPPPTQVLLTVKNSNVIAAVFQETSMIGAAVLWNTTLANATLQAVGIAATVINWKVQIKRFRL